VFGIPSSREKNQGEPPHTGSGCGTVSLLLRLRRGGGTGCAVLARAPVKRRKPQRRRRRPVARILAGGTRGLPALSPTRREKEQRKGRAGEEEEEEVPPYSPREPTRRTRRGRGRGDLPPPGMDLGRSSCPSPRSRSADDEEEKEAGAMVDQEEAVEGGGDGQTGWEGGGAR